jgi:hypothetical protein
MKITREALKRIVIQEMNRLDEEDEDLDATVTKGDDNAPADEDPGKEMGEISEGADMILQVLTDLTAAQDVNEMTLLLKGLGKTALFPLAAAAMGAAGISLADAVGFLKQKSQSSDEMPPQGRDDY